MPEFFKLEKINGPVGVSNSIGFWIYHIKEDVLVLSKSSKCDFGTELIKPCNLSCFKSYILAADFPLFIHNFKKWLTGNTNNTICIRVICRNKLIKKIQIKVSVRFDDNSEPAQLYGAYIDISHREN